MSARFHPCRNLLLGILHATARAWVTAFPLRFGSGVQNKVLESLAVGTPVVATPRVAASLEGPAGLLVGELDEPFAHQLIQVLQDRELRDRSGEAGRAFIEEHHRFPAPFEPLLGLVRDLVRAP